MTTVGIIANPASGKDIRRLVAHGSVFDNEEKVNVVRRVLLGLQAVGVERVLYMPDSYTIGERAARRLGNLSCRLAPVEMQPRFKQSDSTQAAALMVAAGAGCIVTLGGDGTNRAVSKACGDVPLVAISTGTNNVFPTMIEGTLAGIAAGLVARGQVQGAPAIQRTPQLEIIHNGDTVDSALIDAAVYADLFVGARAIWDMQRVHCIALSSVRRGVIGLASVAAALPAVDEQHGILIRIGAGGTPIMAPIAPGIIREVPVLDTQPLVAGQPVALEYAPAMIALDGEREVTVKPGDQMAVQVTHAGPNVVDVVATLAAAGRADLFRAA